MNGWGCIVGGLLLATLGSSRGFLSLSHDDPQLLGFISPPPPPSSSHALASFWTRRVHSPPLAIMRAVMGRNSSEGVLFHQFCYTSEIAPMDSSGHIPSVLPRPLGLLDHSFLSPSLQEGTSGGGGISSTSSSDKHGIVEKMSGRSVEIRLSEDFSPLERVAISADGNLQRIISSYYNAPVSVAIKRCSELQAGIYDRQVDLIVFGQVFCTATSRIMPQTPECAALLASKNIALGQLFKTLGVQPSFRLLDAGKKSPSKDFWRLYELTCPEVTCQILEEFVADTFNMKPQPVPPEHVVSSSSATSPVS